MQGRIAERRIAGAGLSAAAVLCVALAACTMSTETLIFTDSGKYQYHNCEQLISAAKGAAGREEQLRTLIEKAERAPAGGMVSAIAYQADYAAAREDLRVIETTARTKNCATPSTWQSGSAIR